jgi:ABC-2 type transport system permease protein
MFNLIQSDLFKLRKSKAVKVCFCITTLCAIFLVIISHLISNGTLGMSVSGNASLLSDIVVMSTIGSVIAGLFICNDFENKTINATISCGFGRGTLLISKSLVYFLVMAMMLLPYCVVTIIALAFGTKFGTPFMASVFLDILSSEAGAVFSVAMFAKVITIMLTLTIVYAGRLSICVLLAFLLKKPALVVGAGFGLSLVCDLFVGLRGNLGPLGKLLGYTPFAQGYTVLTMNSGAETLLKAIVCSIIFIVVIISIVYSVFRKTEIK